MRRQALTWSYYRSTTGLLPSRIKIGPVDALPSPGLLLSGGFPLIDNSSSRPARPTLADRLERAALILVLVVVAFLAGKVAFGRVVDWTMANSPEAAPDNAGWTNGVISELLPIGVLLFIRYQKRQGRRPGTLAWTALVGACAFSLTAQLAQAVPSVGGWIVAAAPSVAFMVLSKMVVSMRPAQPATARPTISTPPPTSGPGPLQSAPVPQSIRSRTPRVRPKSLTSQAQVRAAFAALGPDATAAQVAARANVSESTARRYLSRPLPPQAEALPATAQVSTV